MLRKILIVSTIIIGSFAQIPEERNQSKELNLTTIIKESIDNFEKKQQQTVSDWYIKDRRKNINGESFIAVISVPQQDTSLEESDEIYKDFDGLSILNDIKYTKDNISAISTLVALPNNNDFNTSLEKKIINDKVFVLHSNYNMNNFNYRVFLKDINLSISDRMRIETSNIQSNGHYNPNNIIENKDIFLLDEVKFNALSTSHIGEYIHLENLKVVSEVKANGKNINIHFIISIGLIDLHIPENHSKIEKLNLSMSIGNLDLRAYQEMAKFSQNYIGNVEKSEEFQMLALELFARSKDMYIDVSDFSVSNTIIDRKETGPMALNAKVSLKGTKELIQMVMVDPQLALLALGMEARIKFHKDVLRKVYKEDKQVGTFLSLFAKYENDNVVYRAVYKEGKLIINDQSIPLSQLGLPDQQLFESTNKLKDLQTKEEVMTSVLPTLSVENTTKNEDLKRKPKANDSIKKDLNTPVKIEMKNVPEIKNKHMEKYGQNMLHEAVLSRKIEDVKKLIANKVFDINQADKLGRTPLHHAAFNGDMEIAKVLLEKGANINAVDKTKSWTPLFFAVFMKHKEMADLLIEYGADKTRKDKLNRTIESYQE